MDSEPSDLTWRKATRSQANGECVEVAAWRKAARSQGNGNCVEVAALGETHIAIRDSKDPQGPHLVFGPSTWRAFAAGLKQR
jgi:hypothetical protein